MYTNTLLEMKIISWNVNGLQGVLKQDYEGNKNKKMSSINPIQKLTEMYKPDILCFQEIKTTKQIDIKSYVPYLRDKRVYWNRAQHARGYSGTLIATNSKPIGILYNFPEEIITECNKQYGTSTNLNNEGRLIALYFDNFTILNVYSPNAGFALKRLHEKIEWWEKALRMFIGRLQTGIHKSNDGTCTIYKRNVIIVGDLNVIPDLDLDRKSLQYEDGSTKEERENFHKLLDDRKLIDSFRHLHPKDKIWSWVPPKLWNKNVMGCRIDFVLVDRENIDKVKETSIITYQGSDHRPILAVIEI